MNLKEMRRRMQLVRHPLRDASDDEVERAIKSVPRHYAGNKVVYGGANTSRGPSPIIWKDFPTSAVAEDRSLGFDFFEDFLSFGGTVTSNVGTYSADMGGYKSYEVTSGSIAQLNTKGPTAAIDQGGVIKLLTPALTANACVALESGYGNGGSFQINGNTRPKLFFEARVQYGNVAGCDFYVGLLEKGGAANNFFFTTGDAINTKSFLGFYSLTGAPTSIKASYGNNGQTAVTVASGTVPAAATTWTKLGFRYDSEEQNGNRLQLYQDGVLLGSVTDFSSTTTTPSTDPLAICFIVQNDATGTAASFLQPDWVRCAQLF